MLAGISFLPIRVRSRCRAVGRPTSRRSHRSALRIGAGTCWASFRPASACLVVDVDTDSDTPVAILEEAVIDNLGPPLCSVQTQSGGRHLFYRCDERIVGNRKFKAPTGEGKAAGDIRHSNGFVVLWNADTLDASLENIEDHDAVDVGKWPIARPPAPPQEDRPAKETSDTPPPERNFDEEEIARMLSHIDPDVGGYDQWMTVGAVLSREGLPMSIWQEWSRSGKSYNEDDFTPYRWKGFKDVTGTKATLGTVIHLAMQNGYKPPKPSTKQTESASQRNSRHYSNLADEWGLPSRLMFDNLEDNDTERITHYCDDDLLAVEDGATIVDVRGLWHDLQHVERFARASVRTLLQRARSKAATDVSMGVTDALQAAEYAVWLEGALPATSYHVRNVTEQTEQRIMAGQAPHVRIANNEDFDDRTTHPVLPIAGGGAFDMRTGRLLTAAELKSMHFRHYGWGMPAPDENILKQSSPSIDAMRSAIADRFGESLITRLAYHFLGLSKSVDALVAPTSWGKSTLISILEDAFPGMIGRLQTVKAFSQQGKRFSQIERELTTRILCIIDEAGQRSPDRNIVISPDGFNMLVDDKLPVERKYHEAATVRRIGTAFMIGHTWPRIDTSQQGMETRIRWAYMIDGKYEKMTRETRELLLMPDALSYFRTVLCRRAVWLYQKGANERLTQTPDSIKAVGTFLAARADPLVTALQNAFQPGDPMHGIPFADVKAVLLTAVEEGEAKKLTAQVVNEKLDTAFHSAVHIRPGRVMQDGKGVPGFFGLVPRGSNTGECSLCGQFGIVDSIGGGQFACYDGKCYR